MKRWLVLPLLLLAACVPAQTPPQLQHTAGAPVIITETHYQTGLFSVRYPAGWRVVKADPAGFPVTVVFVSPDNLSTITLTTEPLSGELGPAGYRTDLRAVQLGDLTLNIIGRAPPELWDKFLAMLNEVVASIRAEE